MDRKEAIKIVRGLYEKSLFLKKDKEAIETLIPEIKDDEDERIRKEMVEYFSQYKEGGLRGVDITPWIAYLERQKEQKSEPAGQDYSGLSEFERAIHRGFLCAGVENVPVNIIKDTAKECLEVINLGGGSSEIPNNQWSEEDECKLNGILADYKSMNATYRRWLKSLPERFNPQPKQELSDEEKRKLNRIYFLIRGATAKENHPLIGDNEANELQGFLSNLSERFK